MRAPILRFAEFTDDWEETTLENLAEVERGKFSVRPRNDPRYFGGEMPFVQTGDVTGSDMYLKGYSQTLNADGIKVSKVFPADTILITIAANIGDTTITQYAVACPDSVVAIQAKKDLANTIFLKNLIDLQKENLDSQATQNAQKNINLQVLKPLQLIAPSKAEQTKIATFLSVVDEKISQLSQKLHLLGQYKQGIMQKLFSQQIRFKADDGSEFGEWEERKLSDICLKIKDGTHFSPKTIEVGDYKYLTSKNVKNGYLDFSNLEFVNAEDHKKIYSSCDVKFGDVLLTKDGTIGQCCVNTLTEEFSLLSSVAFLRLKTQFNNYFLYHLLVSDFGQREINGVIAGQALKRITLTKINNFKFMFPCFEEQTKIANFLSAIDQKIDVVSEQLEQAKLWKKGLLQQMFV